MKKSKKTHVLLITLSLLTLMGCSTKNNIVQTDTKTTTNKNTIIKNKENNTSSTEDKRETLKELNNSDFSFNYKDVQITLDTPSEELLEKIGTGTATEDNNFGFIGWDKDKKFKYYSHGYNKDSSQFHIITRTEVVTGKSTLVEIDLSNFTTKRGISKEDSYNKVLESYGNPSKIIELEDNTKNYFYTLHNKSLVFNIDTETNNILKISLRCVRDYEIITAE